MPSERNVLNAVSSLTTAIQCSLKSGVVRQCSFSVCVQRDVFNYLFKDLGKSVCRRPGKNFELVDFNDKYFCRDDFVYCNLYSESVRVVFPIYMYSHVKFIKLLPTRSDFSETISIKLLKFRC